MRKPVIGLLVPGIAGIIDPRVCIDGLDCVSGSRLRATHNQRSCVHELIIDH